VGIHGDGGPPGITGLVAGTDGFGVGTRLAAPVDAPELEIIYKPVRIGSRDVAKNSPAKRTLPGRKRIERSLEAGRFTYDTIRPLEANDAANDLLQTLGEFKEDPIADIRGRIQRNLQQLPPEYKRIDSPARYPVRFDLDYKGN
jgi:nicotinic acid phosphoribosyltransferase